MRIVGGGGGALLGGIFIGIGSARQDRTQHTVAKKQADGELKKKKKNPKTRDRLVGTSKVILTEIRLTTINEGETHP